MLNGAGYCFLYVLFNCKFAVNGSHLEFRLFRAQRYSCVFDKFARDISA